VRDRAVGILGNRWARAVMFALSFGVIVLGGILAIRSREQETIVLNVLPVDDPNIVRVYVGGEVRQPGIYSLVRGSRVADAIDAAGGITSIGDTSKLGMAATLEDADQIIVAARTVSGGSATVIATGQTLANAPATRPPININTATSAELETLPRIGPAIAGRIIAWREENGPFQTVEELAKVAGISERMVEELRPLVTVGP
jgi:competence protein ComEA